MSGQRVRGAGSPPLRAWMLGLMGLAGFGPLIIQFFWNQWKQEAHQFFPLAITGALLLAWRGCCGVKVPLEPGAGRISTALILVSLAVLLVAALSGSPWLGVAALLLCLAATTWGLGGRELAGALFPAALVLVTILPIPLGLDVRLALTLEQWAVAGSSRALSLLGVDHLLSGNVIQIAGYRLLVEEACSGIVSVIFMTSACVFYAMWRRRSLPALLLLWAITIGCVLAGNILRITSCTWLLVNRQINVFQGAPHEALGIAFMLAYLLCIVLVEAAIPRRATRVGGTGGKSWRAIEDLLLGGRTFPGGLRLLAVALAMLGALQILVFAQRKYTSAHSRHVNPQEMDGSAKFSLPDEIGGWHRRSPAPTSIRTTFEGGVYSHIWEYARGGIVASIALDYPFFNYHDVRGCYRVNGWVIAKSIFHSDGIPCVEVCLIGKGGMSGIVFFSTVNESGGWLDESNHLFYEGEGASEGEGGRIWQRLFTRIVTIPFFQQFGDVGVTYRIQLLADSRDGFSGPERKELQEFFEQSRSLLVKQFVKTPSAP
jgi:exosortase